MGRLSKVPLRPFLRHLPPSEFSRSFGLPSVSRSHPPFNYHSPTAMTLVYAAVSFSLLVALGHPPAISLKLSADDMFPPHSRQGSIPLRFSLGLLELSEARVSTLLSHVWRTCLLCALPGLALLRSSSISSFPISSSEQSFGLFFFSLYWRGMYQSCVVVGDDHLSPLAVLGFEGLGKQLGLSLCQFSAKLLLPSFAIHNLPHYESADF